MADKRKHEEQPNFGGRLAEQQARRLQYRQEGGEIYRPAGGQTRTKRERNRDPKHLAIGKLATD